MSRSTEIDLIVASLEAMLVRLRAQANEPAGTMQTITVKQAAYAAGISEAQMRKRCEHEFRLNPDDGYAIKDGGRWEVVFAPFVNSLPVSALRRVK
jgi:hypothetical protein